MIDKCWGDGCPVSNKVVMEGFTEKMLLEQRPKGGREGSCVID